MNQHDPLKGCTKKLHLCVTRKGIKMIKSALKSAALVRPSRDRAYLLWILKNVEEQEEAV